MTLKSLRYAVFLMLVALATFSPAARSQTSETQGEGTCVYHEEGSTEIVYETSFIKIVTSVFGLFGSTRVCRTVPVTKWVYDYVGPPLELPGPPPPPGDGSASVKYVVRTMFGEAQCAGNMVRPELNNNPGFVQYIAPNARIFRLSMTPMSGRIEDFLGPSFDASPFDPAYLASNAWPGVEVEVPAEALMEPTLVFDVGGKPGMPIVALSDLAAPSPLLLRVDFGATLAEQPVELVVSSTSPGDGPLVRRDGVTVPVVRDAFTAQFSSEHGSLATITDGAGVAWFSFPILTDEEMEGVDVRIAAIALDPASGLVVDASTFVSIQYRDLSVCVE